MRFALHEGDAVRVLPSLPAASVDLVLTDPPYPEIRREYGRWTEAEWWALMRAVLPECMRILKPTGSAVFILQPNSEKVGRMRNWLWDFMGWVGREWGIVQDAWWWNYTSPPSGGCGRSKGLMRGSVKACVWVGPAGCYRSQSEALWSESFHNAAFRSGARFRDGRVSRKSSGGTVAERNTRGAALERGGVTPFNLLPVPGGGCRNRVGGHPSPTPIDVVDWWVRYLCPPGGAVLDPFCGSGTVGLAALAHGASFVGVERFPKYYEVARARLEAAAAGGR